jgi:5'-methylthioadenosine phosphorylase
MIAPRLKASRPAPCPAGCDHALEHALITSPTVRSAEMVAKLDAVAGRVLKK